MTSPSAPAASSAIDKARVPFATSDTALPPNRLDSRASSRVWNGPLLVRIRLDHISRSSGSISSRGGRNGRVTLIVSDKTLPAKPRPPTGRAVATHVRDGGGLGE